MSAQSIILIDNNKACDEIEEFLVQEGNHFRNMIDYDLCSKVEYQKISEVLILKKIMLKKSCDTNIAIIINKLLR